MARGGLLKPDGLAVPLRTHDRSLQVQKVPVVPLCIHGIHTHHPLAADNRQLGREQRILRPAKRPLRGLGPKLPILGPAHPVLPPPGTGIGCEGHGATQPELPVGEEGIAIFRPEGGFGPGLFSGGHMAEQGWITGGRNPAHRLSARPELGPERLLIDRRFQNDGSFLEKNLGQFIGGGDVVKAATTLLRQPDHGLRSEMACDQDRADRDPVFHDGCHQLFGGDLGIAIAEDNDVLEVGRGFHQRLMGHLQHALEGAQIPLVHARDLARQFLLRADLLQVEQPAFGAIPKHHPHLVGRSQRGEHPLRTIACHLVAVGEFHAVHDHHHRAAGQHLFAVQLHADREDRFQRRAPVTARRKSLIPTQTDQPHPEIPHRTLQKFLPFGADIPCGKVADEDGVVTLHLRESGWKLPEVRNGDLQPRSTQRPGERLILRRICRDQENPRIPGDHRERGAPVVLGDWIPGHIQLHIVAVEAALRQGLWKGVEVPALLKSDLLLSQKLLVAEQADGGLPGAVGLRENLHLKGLPALEP